LRQLTERFQRLFNWVKERAVLNGCTEKELSVINLSNPVFKNTKSSRIWGFITLAYYLGQLDGIRYCDEMVNTKFLIDPLEIPYKEVTD
jgi:hypothetical protein